MLAAKGAGATIAYSITVRVIGPMWSRSYSGARVTLSSARPAGGSLPPSSVIANSVGIGTNRWTTIALRMVMTDRTAQALAAMAVRARVRSGHDRHRRQQTGRTAIQPSSAV